MTIQQHAELFQQRGPEATLQYLWDRLQSRDLTENEALALLSAVHQELGRAKASEPKVYATYSRFMEALSEDMPMIHDFVVARWNESRYAGRKPLRGNSYDPVDENPGMDPPRGVSQGPVQGLEAAPRVDEVGGTETGEEGGGGEGAGEEGGEEEAEEPSSERNEGVEPDTAREDPEQEEEEPKPEPEDDSQSESEDGQEDEAVEQEEAESSEASEMEAGDEGKEQIEEEPEGMGEDQPESEAEPAEAEDATAETDERESDEGEGGGSEEEKEWPEEQEPEPSEAADEAEAGPDEGEAAAPD